ncbi:PGF-pre-PGF domain-containing protein [Methanolobus profundi]|uniref:PGF-pre-PGF domain-containing protein n=1 Tax=Methanolobus profundi TaxID=487685 RepID=UPI001160DF8F|nr:PGF-pre-PGF domain-containing protein [Methanolobus profundi]
MFSLTLNASAASLTPVVTEYGKISISVDGLGTAGSDIIQVEKPAGATVRSAYMTAASNWGGTQIPNGSITIDGTGVNWELEVNSNGWNNWADVTSIVESKINSAPSGRIDFTITELSPAAVEGEVLIVIFDDPSQTQDNTAILLFGGQATTGDSFEIGLSEPIDKTTPNLLINMGLAISFGYQPGSQVSYVDVNDERLTSSAGGQDDGYSGNGGLITVGGLDDSNSNPADPYGAATSITYDDELYDIIPFVSNGDSNITVFTQNPSNDDNIFFAYFFMQATTAVVGEGAILSPSDSSCDLNTEQTLTAKLQDDDGNAVAGREVTFEVVSGPHSGTSGSDTTDANGEATFTYTGTSAGTDTVEASFVGSSSETITSNQATVEWTVAAFSPSYVRSPDDSNQITKYGDEVNFSIQSSIFSSYNWSIDGSPVNGTGVTLYNNTDDSSKLSYCLINSSQYIDQADFFMGIYNVSVSVSNSSLGNTDVFSWTWTVTNSSVDDGEDIEFMINKTPDITIVGGNKTLRFNTTDDEKTDDDGVPCSIKMVSFNTSNETNGIQIKVEVLDPSSLDDSSAVFPRDSVYQYLDIGFNNETLANEGSNSRDIEFRVLNNKDGGILIINTVYLRHWNSLEWEAYTPELTGKDDTYSYFIVRDVSGFSPFAVTCNYQYSSSSSSSSTDGHLPAYLKQELLDEGSEADVGAPGSTGGTGDDDAIVVDLGMSSDVDMGSDVEVSSEEEISETSGSSNILPVVFVLVAAMLALFFVVKKRKDEEEQ